MTATARYVPVQADRLDEYCVDRGIVDTYPYLLLSWLTGRAEPYGADRGCVTRLWAPVQRDGNRCFDWIPVSSLAVARLLGKSDGWRRELGDHLELLQARGALDLSEFRATTTGRRIRIVDFDEFVWSRAPTRAAPVEDARGGARGGKKRARVPARDADEARAPTRAPRAPTRADTPIHGLPPAVSRSLEEELEAGDTSSYADRAPWNAGGGGPADGRFSDAELVDLLISALPSPYQQQLRADGRRADIAPYLRSKIRAGWTLHEVLAAMTAEAKSFPPAPTRIVGLLIHRVEGLAATAAEHHAFQAEAAALLGDPAENDAQRRGRLKGSLTGRDARTRDEAEEELMAELNIGDDSPVDRRRLLDLALEAFDAARDAILEEAV